MPPDFIDNVNFTSQIICNFIHRGPLTWSKQILNSLHAVEKTAVSVECQENKKETELLNLESSVNRLPVILYSV